MIRRMFWAVLALAIAQLSCRAEASEPAIQLLDDTRFERGFTVWDPAPGKHVKSGSLRPTEGGGQPVWGLAQWYSRFDLAEARPQRLASGAVRFFDGAKAVTFGSPDSDGADAVFALDGRTEYGGRVPQRGDPWPHLLAERKLAAHPALSEVTAVPFRVSCRLLRSETSKPPGWDDRRHVGQFVFYLSVQNQNRRSPGFGDYLWFGLMLYDSRYRMPPGYAALDRGSAKKLGTGKFIFQSASTRYTDASLHDGDWVTIDADLLPLIHEGLKSAWDAGFLEKSRRESDYRLGGMNMGWEVTGPLDVAAQVRELRLEATPAAETGDL